MDLTKPSPLDPASAVPTSTARGEAGIALLETGSAGLAASTPDGAVQPLADLIKIRALDVGAALQICIAEVRAGLAPTGPPAVPGQVPPHSVWQAAEAALRIFLESIPDTVDAPPTWMAAADRSEGVLRSALDRAVDVVTRWPDVTRPVVEAALEARAQVLAQLTDTPPNPAWLTLAWNGLAAPMERFWRRRRLARRNLTDPDWLRSGPGSGDQNAAPDGGGSADGATDGAGRDAS